MDQPNIQLYNLQLYYKLGDCQFIILAGKRGRVRFPNLARSPRTVLENVLQLEYFKVVFCIFAYTV